jgi:hypothetical protein
MTISHDPVDNALNPAWRDTVVHLITSHSWKDSLSKPQVKQVVDDMTFSKLNLLRQLAPESGAYLNEVIFISLFFLLLAYSLAIHHSLLTH